MDSSNAEAPKESFIQIWYSAVQTGLHWYPGQLLLSAVLDWANISLLLELPSIQAFPAAHY